MRFGPNTIRSTYLIDKANFVACNQFDFMDKLNVIDISEEGAIFLLNSPHPAEEVWNHLPRTVQRQIIDKKLRFYVIDAYSVAKEKGLGPRINTIMQTCFFYLSKVIPFDLAVER